MKELFAERFKSARLMKGFSLQEVANAIGNKVSRQALHRYEKGEILPDSEMLSLLSKAFDVNVDYFFRETKVELGDIEYRKLDNLLVKDSVKIVEQTREYLSRYIELEEIIGIEPVFENPLNNITDLSSYNLVNNAAMTLRDAWGLGTSPIYNVAELLEDKHIKLVKLDADLAFDGLQTWVNNSIPVIAYNIRNLSKKDRIRFTLLHELAHLLLSKAMKSMTHRQKETVCHQFAGAVLLPEETLKSEIGNHRSTIMIPELGNIKKQYGISMQAIVMRAKDCGIINDHYTKQTFFMFKQFGWRVDEPAEYDFEGREESSRFEQLIFRALAEEQISTSKASALQNKRLADFRKEYSI